ncbi:hypothetical protein Vadar_000469 [Vaccinium darrowii]|nr:hypothetical protein Vadar_000469 [Vaccinium darrowii]
MLSNYLLRNPDNKHRTRIILPPKKHQSLNLEPPPTTSRETTTTTTTTNPSQLHHFLSLQLLQKSKKSLLALLSLLLLLLVAYNGAIMFTLQIPLPPKPEPTTFSTGIWNVAEESKNLTSSSTKLSSTVICSLKEENPPSLQKTHLPILQKPLNLVLPMNNSVIFVSRMRRKKHKPTFKIQHSDRFSTTVKEFLRGNSCPFRFFMTWISSLDSFGGREMFTIESLFSSHPNGCLIIISDSMDSSRGMQVLRPFLDKGFRVMAISPDFDYLFKNTMAQSWFNRLRRGHVRTGEVSLGQNLSNLLRLALVYKFGGIYMDTDVIVLKSFAQLRNVIGAQTIDLETGNWSRLNNAVMVFDKGHPLLYKFIEEFALTFNGNKWGHNGPYLVSRVVSRVEGRPGFDFSVLRPMSFYPVDWSRIRALFRSPRNETHSKWLRGKLNHIRNQSYAVHLWNRQSRKLEVEKGSIIGHLMSDCCVFCNSSAPMVYV